jgi:hypothetical protein
MEMKDLDEEALQTLNELLDQFKKFNDTMNSQGKLSSCIGNPILILQAMR